MVSMKRIAIVAGLLTSIRCADAPVPLQSDTAIHLEDRLDSAEIESASLSTAALQEVTWSFEEPPTGAWKPLRVPVGGESRSPSRLVGTDGALRLSISEEGRHGLLTLGGLYVDLEDWDFDDWEAIVLQARTSDPVSSMIVALDLEEGLLSEPSASQLAGILEATPVFSNGELQTYVFPVRRPEPMPEREAGSGGEEERSWRQLGIAFGALRESSINIVSISIVPSGGTFREAFGVKSEAREHSVRKTLFAHTPARLSYRVSIPPAGRLDFDLGVVRSDVPVSFKILVEPEGQDERVVFEEDYTGALRWRKASVDLSEHAGSSVTLSLQADAAREGTVALWGAPTLSGTPRSAKPNVIFYVIDGGGADFMSVYGYNRRTTPFMERLAEEGVVFERAYSNSTWTQPSTASFMTSLHHSVLGGLSRGAYSSPVPESATTMAEHLQAAGYLTASFTTNPNAGRLIGVERGMDVLVEHLSGLGEETAPSSTVLHEEFWRFREQYPAQPYAVHFQTTDVHWPYHPEPPFAGLYVSHEEREELAAWEGAMFGQGFSITSIVAAYRDALEREGIDRLRFYQRHRDLYDETMAQQDYRLQQLVERLKAAGEWERTLLIIGADHGHPAGSFSRFGQGMLDPEPPDWEGALLGSFNTRIPLIIVWPEGIAGGRRFSQPVSMIDVLPTVLDLAGLPPPEILQGQSLAPLLRGEEGWEARPVVFDEFRVDAESGEWIGNIEMIDGRWGASLEIGPAPKDAENADPKLGRHAIPAGGRWGATHPYFPEIPRLLLYDLSVDPYAVHHVNDRYPDLVEAYRERLLSLWDAHRALAQKFQAAGDAALTPEQLRQLRALGYIQ
jgi:arylsulfatase A-like enzyme